MVRDHYLKLGFSLRSEEDGCRHFVLLLSEFVAEKSPMEVRRVHASGADVLSAA
jgi:hypothetical protein